MLEIHHAHNSLILQGTIEVSDVEQLKEELERYAEGDTLHLNLFDTDIEEGKAMAGMTELLKRQLKRGLYVRLEGPPQLLVHNLYRIGFHPHPCLVVEAMRNDEAYG